MSDDMNKFDWYAIAWAAFSVVASATGHKEFAASSMVCLVVNSCTAAIIRAINERLK